MRKIVSRGCIGGITSNQEAFGDPISVEADAHVEFMSKRLLEAALVTRILSLALEQALQDNECMRIADGRRLEEPQP